MSKATIQVVCKVAVFAVAAVAFSWWGAWHRAMAEPAPAATKTDGPYKKCDLRGCVTVSCMGVYRPTKTGVDRLTTYRWYRINEEDMSQTAHSQGHLDIASHHASEGGYVEPKLDKKGKKIHLKKFKCKGNDICTDDSVKDLTNNYKNGLKFQREAATEGSDEVATVELRQCTKTAPAK